MFSQKNVTKLIAALFFAGTSALAFAVTTPDPVATPAATVPAIPEVAGRVEVEVPEAAEAPEVPEAAEVPEVHEVHGTPDAPETH